MIVDVVMTLGVLMVLALATAARVTGYSRAMRPWLWIALLEYMLCAVAQFVFALSDTADSNYYRQAGIELARFLDAQFGWASQELLALLLQRPSAFDLVVSGAGTNTGSVSAAAAFLSFFSRGSEYAAHALVAGLSMMGALSIYESSRDAYPEIPPSRLFVATVLFPSVAFWTSALHKEAFCLMGTGLLLAAWRAAYKAKIRALVYGPLGVILILMFRAPALPPLLLGLVIYFVVNRIQKTRGAETTLVGPVYLALGLGVLAAGMILVSRVSPDLALDRLGETVAGQQLAWSRVEGGSSFDLDDTVAQTTAAQLAAAPFALMNALFRPQLFDVTSPVVLVSALEMTAITYMIFRAFRIHGIGGVLIRVQRSPFLLMCTVITLVGCTFVGLTTKNFGSMARYRVPFLPFYGALMAALTAKATTAVAPKPAKAPGPRGASARPPRTRPVRT